MMILRLICKPRESAVEFWIIAVLSLYCVQLFIPSLFRVAQPGVGLLRYVGSRDDLPPLGTVGGRSERAVRNLAESLPFFLTAAILTIALNREDDLALLGAQIFFWARVAYLGLYLAAVPWFRSIMWSVAFGGIVLMAWPPGGVVRSTIMSYVRVTRNTHASPETCWSLMADFANIDLFNPHLDKSFLFEGSPAHGLGTERQCDLKGGKGYLRERVIGWQQGRSYTVEVFDSTLPVDGTTTTLGLVPRDAGASLFMETSYNPRWGIVGFVLDAVVLRRVFAANLAGVIAGLAEKAEAIEAR